MRYRRMPIEVESPEELGYDAIAHNLAESSFSDLRLADYGIDGDVSDMLLQYGDHRGLPELRALIARDGLDPGDVLVVAGAAPALFLVHTALLAPGHHALVTRPNYATNVETPRRSAPTWSTSTCASRTRGRWIRSASPRRCGRRPGS
jgi:aspartate/methionine/tyrosine aminotransferase